MLLGVWLVGHQPAAHGVTDQTGLVGLQLLLRKLAVTGTVMHVTAHPDDENNALMAMQSHGEGLRVVAGGLAVGALVSLAAARWLEPLLYGVSPRDPLTYGAVVVALLLAAVLACLVPARRAARVSPSEALRAE